MNEIRNGCLAVNYGFIFPGARAWWKAGRILRISVCLAAAVSSIAPPAQAQRVTSRGSGPQASFVEGFTTIVAVRELTDGRVVIVDSHERRIAILDSSLTQLRPVGRHGAGPGEFEIPMGLFALVGDSSAVYDPPNSRMLVITPAGETGGVLGTLGLPIGEPARLSGVHQPAATDGSGNFYAQSAAGVEDGGTTRHGPLLRWNTSDPDPDTVALLPLPEQGRVISAPGAMVARLPMPLFQPRAVWAVARDGRVAIVFPEPYHVEIVHPDGTRRRGTAIPVEPLKLTDEHKTEWRREVARTQLRVVVARGGGSAYRTISEDEVAEPPGWEPFLPPFLSDAAGFAGDGRLWVRRTTPPDRAATYDVFDANARLVEVVVLPPNRRLAGFGADAVYLVRRDDFDLEYLERWILR
ncbi:MAG: hypothetical protein WEF86_08980 [Gemmatimonadota bacterium]